MAVVMVALQVRDQFVNPALEAMQALETAAAAVHKVSKTNPCYPKVMRGPRSIEAKVVLIYNFRPTSV